MKTIAVHPTYVQRSSLSLLFCTLEAVLSVKANKGGAK